jgi:hypothetical protein
MCLHMHICTCTCMCICVCICACDWSLLYESRCCMYICAGES